MTGDIRGAVMTEALTWAGTPYRHQASSKGIGCDCLGLVRGVWRSLYGTEPEEPGPYSPDWAELGSKDRMLDAARRHAVEKNISEALPSDLLIFRWRAHHAAKHVGILINSDGFLHAYEGHAVMISPLIPQWRRRIAGVFAFPEKTT